MNEANQLNLANKTAPSQEPLSFETLNELFTLLNPNDVEQFYKIYQSWALEQQRIALITKIATLQQEITENAEQMQRLAPSALSLASLTQLQACGVEDVDLLERMLERGEAWLDHTIQLLIRCEELDLIGSNYTEWCEHALEGAYDWIDSIREDNDQTSATLAEVVEEGNTNPTMGLSAQITEELILQKLMSDDEGADETEKLPMVYTSKMTQPLSPQDTLTSEEEASEIQNPPYQLEVSPVVEVESQPIASTLDEVHKIEEIGQEKPAASISVDHQQIEEANFEPVDVIDILNEQPTVVTSSQQIEQPSLAEAILQDAAFEPVDPIDGDQQLPTAISTNTETELVNLTEDILQHPADEDVVEPVDTIHTIQEPPTETSTSTETDPVHLTEPLLQHPANEDVFEPVDTIHTIQEPPTSTSTETNPVHLTEDILQHPTDEDVFEPVDTIHTIQEPPTSTSTETNPVHLTEDILQHPTDEDVFEPVDTIHTIQEPPTSTSTETDPVHLTEPLLQHPADEDVFEPVNTIDVAQEPVEEEKKPQQKAISSKRGFLQRLLARIWGR